MASTLSRSSENWNASRVSGLSDTDDEKSLMRSRLDSPEVGGDDAYFEDSLPPLPSTSDSDLLLSSLPTAEGDTINGDSSGVNETEIHRHLQDVEPSFVPEPGASRLEAGADAGRSGQTGGRRSEVTGQKQGSTFYSSASRSRSNRYDEKANSPIPSTPPDAYKTPAARLPSRHKNDEDDFAVGNSTSELETISSSPMAAAAARTVSRAISMATRGEYEDSPKQSPRALNVPTIKETEATPTRKEELRTPRATTPLQQVQTTAEEPGSVLGGLDDVAAEVGKHRTRPRVLRSRLSSHRSSYSSYTTTSSLEASDATIGADFALQTGGAAPAVGLRPGLDLSRATSLNSLASRFSFSDQGDMSKINSSGVESSLSALEESISLPGDVATADPGDNIKPRVASVPGSPKARNRGNTTPTDTVIAQHVTSVEVPPTFARQYLDRTKNVSPSKLASLPAPTLGRGGRHLSLKEQTNQVDRLSKENWNLKLKVTFLDEALRKYKDKDTQALIEENADWQMKNIELKRENKDLRRKIKSLEIQLKAMDTGSDDHLGSDEPKEQFSNMEEREILYLRERVETYEDEIERLEKDAMAREADKIRLADLVKSLEKRRNSQDDIVAQDESDAWRSLLESEQARREEVDEENRKLKEELFRLQNNETSTSSRPGNARNGRTSKASGSTGLGQEADRTGANTSSSITLVEQLRHENDELRREVSAQTSMLTSRNREKERLYQEIEDLKMSQRGTLSVTGESIWERSASRAAPLRSPSRITTATSQLSDPERERYENKMDKLRDEIVQLKVDKQDLLSKLDNCLDELEQADNLKKENAHLEEELDGMMEDLQTMQAERDEALKLREDIEAQFQQFQTAADEDIATLEGELDEKDQDCEKLETELHNQKDAFVKLQNEMRLMGEGLTRLEDDAIVSQKKIQSLQQELGDANKELEEYEQSLLEAKQKIERLSVQQESSQNEIAFLREEQDADKIKIGDLEALLKDTQTSLQIERDKSKELEERLVDERRQHEAITSRDKQEVQKKMNELNRDVSASKEESRKLKKSLATREEEVKMWKSRLDELEGGLRKILGDSNSTRAGLLTLITNIQTGLNSTAAELEITRRKLDEKEQLLKRRDAQLESHGLEYKRLTEVLHRERQARQADKHSFEQSLKATQSSNRTMTQKDARISDLESMRRQDRSRFAHIELQYKDQLTERNTLLLSLWNKLSSMCGADWTHSNALIEGNLPTLDVVANMLPGFSENLFKALKALEATINGSKTKIRSVERDLWKDYQTLEHTLEARMKKLDRLENIVNTSRGQVAYNAEISRLKNENRHLKSEISVMQQKLERAQHRPNSTLIRHHSHTAVEALEDDQPDIAAELARLGAQIEPGERRWIFRLKELEKRLKAEREARLLDRSGARKRLEEGRAENEELKRQLERERVRRSMDEVDGAGVRGGKVRDKDNTISNIMSNHDRGADDDGMEEGISENMYGREEARRAVA